MRATIGAIAIALAVTHEARAEDTGRDHRGVGIGLMLGGGLEDNSTSAAEKATAVATGADEAGGLFELPSLELRFFLDRRSRVSLDVTIPLTDALYVTSHSAFLWQSDFMVSANIGRGTVRGILGGGLGFTAYTNRAGDSGALRLPAQFLLELLTDNRAFGFQIGVRPWVEFIGSTVPGTPDVGFGTGALAVIGFAGYVRR